MKKRVSKYNISNLILNRWSPRALDGKNISDKDLMGLFEAARWAPSAFNEQPWRFVYAKRNGKEWKKFFNLLTEGNKGWCKNASALVVVISSKKFSHNNKKNLTHQFDTGASWENLALEAYKRKLIAHGMSGFDYKKTRKILKIPEEYSILAMIAIGRKGDKNKLPEKLQKMEFPNQRKPLNEIVMRGKFNSKILK